MHLRSGHRLLTVTTTLLCTALPPLALLPLAPVALAAGLPVVDAERETPALFDDEAGSNSNADDPAIWLHPTNHGRSVVVATAKEGGLRAYSLTGRQLQSIAAPVGSGSEEAGRFNNVDLAYGVRLAGVPSDLAVVSDRGRDTLRTYRIDPAAAAGGRAPLTDVSDPAAPPVFSSSPDEVGDQATAYGLATWRDPASGQHYALVSRRHTTQVALVRLVTTPAGTITYTVERRLTLPSSFRLPDGSSWTPCGEPGELPQVEGMVVDAQTGVLYAGQEDVGIWRMPATLTGTPVLMDKVREFGVPATFDPDTEECEVSGPDPGAGGKHISADVEGLTIYYRGNGRGYLLASSQGDDTFVVYQRAGGNEYVATFRIGPDSDGPDGSEQCDGAMVLNVPLGPDFDEGLLVVQDGVDTPDVRDPAGEVRTNTNFKFVEWDDVADETGLAVDTSGWHPRR
ncbi:phytase [Couchioplanes caeruleus]|uniref:Hydrolase n=2 Tax=Couchioplanes caeruleus TaxID=56438 RepID=A0A1K0GEF9_9ACTN|nr:phytase [Couchioplanes caeruleus]OJF10534.1 hydrolase [Couchioplanes caeruleus subsp. caeruleus]ROP28629.1 3-phytase [Couchioplanes caeruleus]